MGIQFCSRITIPNTNLNMKFLVALCLVASAMALEDTADVAAAKADFNAAFMAAEAGEHAALAPAPVASFYLADDAAVAEAKAAFAAAFAAAEKGEHAALAPKPVEALPVPELVAPVAPAVAPLAPLPVTYAGIGAGLPYFNGYYHGAYPYHHGYAGYPYVAGYPYAYSGYPYVYTLPAAAEKADE